MISILQWKYDTFIDLNNFNTEISITYSQQISESYYSKNQIEKLACFKSADSPSSVDFILKNHPKWFQTSCPYKTGIYKFYRLKQEFEIRAFINNEFNLI